MATSSTTAAAALSFLSATRPLINTGSHQSLFSTGSINNPQRITTHKQTNISFRISAAKLPAGVELPKVEPRFSAPFLGFTRTAEIWNSRACMIGLIGTFLVELILNKSILQIIGIDVGKGLDLPL